MVIFKFPFFPAYSFKVRLNLSKELFVLNFTDISFNFKELFLKYSIQVVLKYSIKSFNSSLVNSFSLLRKIEISLNFLNSRKAIYENNSIDITSHGYSDLSHQKRGNIEDGNYNQLNDSSG